MCLITFSYQTDTEYPFVMIANRDELFSRPSLPIHEWDNPKDIIGGRDLKQSGTWLAFSKKGKFAALTNYPFIDRNVEDPISRGLLINDYLNSDIATMEFIGTLRTKKDLYEGFHLLLGNIYPNIELKMYNNVDDQLTSYEPGFHTISNTYDDLSAYRKCQSIKELSTLLQDKVNLDKMITSFQNKQSNPNLVDFPSHLTLEQAKKASAIFVEREGEFGTVSTTAIAMNKTGHLIIKEVRYLKNKTNESTEIKYNFN